MKAVIYYEGHRFLKEGFRKFFNSYFNGSSGEVIAKLINCGSTPIEDFLDGVNKDKINNFFHILLMDSDVLGDSDFHTAVRRRTEWKKSGIDGVINDQFHFMVKMMEAWFLADREALKIYFGRKFRVSKLPRRIKVEEIPAADVKNGLDEATRNTGKGTYSSAKPIHGSKILALIDPQKVKDAAPHCGALFDILETIKKDHNG